MLNSTLRKGGILSLLLLGFAISITYAQEITITGTVFEEASGEPIIGVTVVVKGTTTGAVSDLDGKYSITANKGETLIFTSIGFVAVEEIIGDATTIDVVLSTSYEELDEVVVIGYGSVKKEDATGSVTSVKADDFNRGATTSPSGLLQGKAAGVMITNSSGDPGANSTIRIRGNSSVRAGNDPLIVVDGVPLAGGNTSADADLETLGGMSSARNPLNFINPNDIANMYILKDASATAIYGSRGANGVIIITTKQGLSGDNLVEYNASFSTASVSNKIKLHSASEFAALAPTQDQGGNVDALDAILRNSFSQDHNLSFRGGNDDLKYRLSLGYMNQEGIVKESSLEKYTANLNVTQELFNDRLKISSSMIYSTVNDTYAPVSTNAGFEGSLIGNALTWNPTRDFKLPDGSWDQFSQSDTNPLALLEYFDDQAKTIRFLGNISAELEILEGLYYKVNLGVDQFNSKRSYEMSRFLNRVDILDEGFARVDNVSGHSFLLEHTLTYAKVFGSYIRFRGLLGYSYQAVNSEGSSIWGRGFEYDQVPYVNQLQSISQDKREVASGKNPTSELQSYFGRVKLTLFDKLLATVTVRADGSSKFGANNKYGWFQSFALAYRLSDEDFIPDTFNDLKLRVGWGKTGNQEFPPGSSQAQYEITRDGLTRSQYDNPDLKWETSTTLNIGLDFSLWDRRLTGTFEYFNKNTVDLLFNAEAALPGPSGARRWTNLDANVNNS